MKSVRQMIEQCEGLIDTMDVTEWENEFLRGLVDRAQSQITHLHLSEKQTEMLERIYARHFA